jgi:hypothetical protein
MTEHYSHVGGDEKLKVAGQIVQLVPGLGTGSPIAPPSGGSGGGSSGERSSRVTN